MKISFHIGAHCTDEEQLLRSLLRNSGVLAREGICVPGPSRYRGVLADVLNKLQGAKADLDTQEMLIEHFVDLEDAERIVFGHDNFLGASFRAFEGGVLYGLAERNTKRLRNLFPMHQVEFFMGMRDISTFLPALAAKVPEDKLHQLLAGVDPRHLYWSDTLHAIREATPDCPITVWCNEDTPLIWPEILHEVAGLDPEVKLMGGLDILAQIMARPGIKRLRDYLASHPIHNEIQRRRVLAAFLSKYALEEEIEEEITLPGWTQDLMQELSQSYDDDMLEIKSIPGVTLLTA
ncbi:hypothetical protein K3X13_04195 [Aliiroseovarius crassostreae]|uniref:hypothetical protein n=1 Tax=Aliiroseovarius crassostreae TaxID=154981 RepID=UPI002207FE72|nr:hypothetical protein [Aliiroseovarius crassostreae]UWP89903.1 hypothetical protein K3J57_04220 [Aliiroseovarius crassostreae]UWP93057.1 hypothetical protein K3X13_04195 [Aliiroseovarius crassostreae]UWQ02552.1 hypothetical protein K3X44_04225 [Aliiroseovarius crassostreae]